VSSVKEVRGNGVDIAAPEVALQNPK